MRRIYELSCYTNIPALYNLLASSKLMFAYFNLNLKQAALTGYGQLKEMLDMSPYFQEHFQRNMKNNSEILWPQANMMVRSASGTEHIIGTALVAAILDEANFYKNDGVIDSSKINEVQSKAKEIYTSIRTRRRI